MNSADRVIVNTIAQYTRALSYLFLSLFSTRIILDALGVNDYGIYALIAGVVAMLAFVVNALVITTQRYMSYYNATNNIGKQKEIFCNSIFIHIGLGISAAIIIELLGLALFDGILNIEKSRIHAAIIVYHSTTLMLVLSFITAPFKALLISHENIVYISFVEILGGILKLLIAVYVALVDSDRLILYAILLCSISLLDFFFMSGYDYIKYEECIFPRLKYLKKNYIKEISSFAGWTIYSVGCITGRSQGLAVILNQFYGVAINAAYGIAIQVNGAIAFVSNSVVNAMSPQIVKAEGSGDRKKMLRLAEIESKFSFLLLGMVVIPIVFEMPDILRLWLKDIPNNTILFCRFILIANLVDQITIGLGNANQAIGNIRNYSLVVNTTKILSLIPIIVVLLIINDFVIVMLVYVFFEFLCALIRLVLLKRMAGLNILDYCMRVFLRSLLPFLSIILTSIFIVNYFNGYFRFIISIIASCLVMLVSTYYWGLCSDEKTIVKQIICKTLYKNRIR